MRHLLVALAAAIFSTSAFAAKCESGDFNGYIAEMKREAQAARIGAKGVAALDGLTLDQQVLKLDKNQAATFNQSFEQFSKKMIEPRITKGRVLMGQHVGLLQRIDAAYGVTPGVVVAIWGLETSYGGYTGNFSTLRALATLGYDCRRGAKFQAELLDALRIVDSGDLTPAQMKGAWAGEIGQTQFMPSSYLKYAVDFDGDGKRDLLKSVPDVLASTANFLKENGWQRGADWDPGKPNFPAIQKWNASDVYSRTVAEFASQLAGR